MLRVGYAGTMGAITDIDQEGFPAAAFHSFPDMLKPDPITGDYGPNFFGHAWNTATYVVKDPQFGAQAFGGNITRKGNLVEVTPLDSARMRVYLASLGLWLTLESGTFDRVQLDPATGKVRIGFAPSTQFTSQALLTIERPAKIHGVGTYHPKQQLQMERGAYIVPLTNDLAWIDLTP